MPIVHVSMLAGKRDAYRAAILDELYLALRDTLGVPEDDNFMTITEHEPTNFRYGNAFGGNRSDDLLYIAITLFDTRTADHKAALFKRIAERLSDNPGMRPEDVFINVYDTPKVNWSVGHGDQQFAPGRPSHG